MPVYMIRAGENGPVKIGFSVDVFDRLRQMRVGHWHHLALIRCLNADRSAEKRLHKMFAHMHIRNEWFSFDPFMMCNVGYPDMSIAQTVRQSNPTQFNAIVAAFGGLKRVGQITGDRSHAVCQWRHAGIPHKVWHLLIEAAQQAGIQGITVETLAATRPDLWKQ